MKFITTIIALLASSLIYAQVLIPNELEWATATETDNSHFNIERSADGMNFETIASIAGQGTTTTMHEYRFVDHAPLTGGSYYRLRNVDFDGDEELSEIVFVAGGSSTAGSISVYPNPASDFVRVALTGVDHVAMQILDMSGRIVIEQQSQGNDRINMQVAIDHLPAGSYLVALNFDGGSEVNRIVIN